VIAPAHTVGVRAAQIAPAMPSFVIEEWMDGVTVRSTVVIVFSRRPQGRSNVFADLPLEHDPEKWMPVFRKIMLQRKN
jgi:hypothetical protein